MKINGTVAKDVTRQIVTKVFEAFAENKSKVTIYSLPGQSWEFEKNVLINHYVNNREITSLHCFEHNIDSFYANWDIAKNVLNDFICEKTYVNDNKIQIELLSENQHRKNGLLFFYQNKDIKTNEVLDNEDVFAWYDFCGNPSVERLNKIDLTTKNSVQIFTFVTGWRCEDNVESSIRQAAANSSSREAIINYFQNKIEGSGYKIIFDIEYVSSHTPMILIAISNDKNVLDKKYFTASVKIKKEKRAKQIKIDKAPIYAALKAGMSTEQIMAKLNFSKGTISSCKAWITMGK